MHLKFLGYVILFKKETTRNIDVSGRKRAVFGGGIETTTRILSLYFIPQLIKLEFGPKEPVLTLQLACPLFSSRIARKTGSTTVYQICCVLSRVFKNKTTGNMLESSREI